MSDRKFGMLMVALCVVALAALAASNIARHCL